QTITNQGTHTVVYVATEKNTIYAIDGDTGAILLHHNLGAPVSYLTTGGCGNNSSVIGVGATPVIDPSKQILYVITDTLNNNAPTFTLHALNPADLTVATPSLIITASQTLSVGSTSQFNASVTRSRSALLSLTGNIYAGFASYCDFNRPITRGWLLGWTTGPNGKLVPLSNRWLTNRLATSPDTFFLTPIWMSGSGVASDGQYLYFVTGNSDTSGNTLNN